MSKVHKIKSTLQKEKSSSEHLVFISKETKNKRKIQKEENRNKILKNINETTYIFQRQN